MAAVAPGVDRGHGARPFIASASPQGDLIHVALRSAAAPAPPTLEVRFDALAQGWLPYPEQSPKEIYQAPSGRKSEKQNFGQTPDMCAKIDRRHITVILALQGTVLHGILEAAWNPGRRLFPLFMPTPINPES